MKTDILITEDELDARLMEALLRSQNIKGVKCIPAGGWSSVDSLARSYLTERDTKVAIVVDADSLDENAVEERKRFLRRSLGQIAEKSRWRVLVIKPEVEALLFEDQAIIMGLIDSNSQLNQNDFTHGYYEPRAALGRLLKGTPMAKVYEKLKSVSLSPILEKNLDIKDLIDFFNIQSRKVAV